MFKGGYQIIEINSDLTGISNVFDASYGIKWVNQLIEIAKQKNKKPILLVCDCYNIALSERIRSTQFVSLLESAQEDGYYEIFCGVPRGNSAITSYIDKIIVSPEDDEVTVIVAEV